VKGRRGREKEKGYGQDKFHLFSGTNRNYHNTNNGECDCNYKSQYSCKLRFVDKQTEMNLLIGRRWRGGGGAGGGGGRYLTKIAKEYKENNSEKSINKMVAPLEK
jgi:hypothetical protein